MNRYGLIIEIMDTCAVCLLNGLCLEIRRGSALDMASKEAVIVNAANKHLDHKGGIAGQLISSGGNRIQDESHTYISMNGPLKTSDVCETTAGNLQFFKIIHTVGPIYDSNQPLFSQCDDLVAAVYNAIDYAQYQPVSVVSFPLISSGIFGFPIDKAAKCHVEAFIIYSQNKAEHSRINKIVLSLFKDEELVSVLKAACSYRETFDWFKYYGTSEEQGRQSDKAFCSVCKQTQNLEFMKASSICCKKICDFCIFAQALVQCTCGHGAFKYDFSFILCKYCRQLKYPSHQCRMICVECFYSRGEVNKCLCGMRLNNS